MPSLRVQLKAKEWAIKETLDKLNSDFKMYVDLNFKFIPDFSKISYSFSPVSQEINVYIPERNLNEDRLPKEDTLLEGFFETIDSLLEGNLFKLLNISKNQLADFFEIGALLHEFGHALESRDLVKLDDVFAMHDDYQANCKKVKSTKRFKKATRKEQQVIYGLEIPEELRANIFVACNIQEYYSYYIARRNEFDEITGGYWR